MLKNPPFSGSFSILQSFGENPEYYQQFAIDGVSQRGHNGIDYVVPFATPVLACEDATVLEVGSDADGFGTFVVLGHSWGQTLYAHLSEVVAAVGATVAAGDQIGYSGASGNANEPHLHFGLRVAPFSLHDGWFGYSNPAPYLLRVSQAKGPIIGPHLVGRIDLELLRNWQPRMLLVLDPNPDEMLLVRRACPNTTIIGRVFATDHEIAERIRSSPVEAANWAHGKVMERMNPHVDYWQFANEVLQHQDELYLLNQFEHERMMLADAEGFKCAILAFSVGNPDLPEDDRMACWEKVYPAIEYAEENEHVVAVHQYGMPDLLGPDGLTDWLILRLEHQVLMRLPFKKVKFAVTEYGVDGLIQGPSPSGWKHFTNAEDYAEQLIHNGQYLERFSGRILGYAVFTLGHFSPWGSYDIMGAVSRILADTSERGTWSDVQLLTEPLGNTQGDTTSSPGIGAGGQVGTPPPEPATTPTEPTVPAEPDSPVEPGLPDTPGGDSGTDTPTENTTGGNNDEVSQLPTVERRLSDGFGALNGSIRRISERPDVDLATLNAGDVVYLVRDVFTTKNGSWELSNDVTSITQWARDAYLKPFGAPDWFDDAGADHHLFGAVIGLDGQLIRNQKVISWSDGFERLAEADYTDYVESSTKASSGWSNQPLGPGSSYVPDRGESGPWCLMPEGTSEVYVGAGLPSNHHVSTFVVWQAVALSQGIVDTTGSEPGTGVDSGTDNQPEPVEPDDGTTQMPPVTVPPTSGPIDSSLVEQRIGDWADQLNVSVVSLQDRPDASTILDGEEIVYVLKDLFTTRDGSWETSDKPGSIPDWAREYLKPFGAHDYFDDAGGDRHLFASVIGLDGQFIPNKEIAYWSDGIAVLNDPAYSGYVLRQTKDKSGWINIPIGPGSNFVPERGETGPWCWAPTGAADVVCGGGLPAKQHVATFAVWQAVRKADLVVEQSETDQQGNKQGENAGGESPETPGNEGGEEQTSGTNTNIFMPFIAGGPGSRRRSAESQVSRSAAATPAAEISDASANASLDAASELRSQLTPDGEADAALVESLRANAWIRAGVEYASDSPLAAYARANGLGMPGTDTFEVDRWLVQGYSGGIVYAPKEKLQDVRHTNW